MPGCFGNTLRLIGKRTLYRLATTLTSRSLCVSEHLATSIRPELFAAACSPMSSTTLLAARMAARQVVASEAGTLMKLLKTTVPLIFHMFDHEYQIVSWNFQSFCTCIHAPASKTIANFCVSKCTHRSHFLTHTCVQRQTKLCVDAENASAVMHH